jgi:hypothetical protein
MLEASRSAPWVAELAAADPLLAAKLRGLELRQQMLKAAGGALSSRGLLANCLGKRVSGFRYVDPAAQSRRKIVLETFRRP